MRLYQCFCGWRKEDVRQERENSLVIISSTRQGGAGLIEVLIALLLLSTSLLGMGMLQVKTLQYQRASYSETMAQLLASDMAERMQSNLAVLSSYDGKTTRNAPANSCATNCSSTTLVARDLSEWRRSIEESARAGLTNGEGVIAVDSVADRQRVTLTVSWEESLKSIKDQDDNSTSKARFVFEVRL
ncbi:type IV pilus modification protein PilV [Halomonas sp. PR-M31]|uniref:type IV pilus modification protein PilV n=1 Tax=Halomonas sp. PR-M31 TaxID=1471202 RepID=UPI00069F2654|nr:type IV pilus modification protein PilV [Halomonas sp. PR-M31]